MADSLAPLLDKVPAPWLERFRAMGRIAAERGQALALVGGCVRDLLLGRAPLDWDVAAEGPAEELVRRAAKDLGADRTVRHSAFLTYTLHFPDRTSLDVATARTEKYPRPACLPQDVKPAALADDFRRRDFAVNAMAAHVTPDRWGEIADPLGGRADLERGVVRALHPASFRDDPTRIYRAARYAGRYGWRVEPETEDWIRAAVRDGHPALLTPVRLRHELEHLLAEEDAAPAMRLLEGWGMWRHWSEAWYWSEFLHRALAERRPRPVVFRLMALASAGPAERAGEDLRRLQFSKRTTDAVVAAVPESQNLRRLAGGNKANETVLSTARFPDVLKLKESRNGDPDGFFDALRDLARLTAEDLGREDLFRTWEDSFPLLTGDDLRKMGYKPGPRYADLLTSIRCARLSGEVRSREDEVRHVRSVDNLPRKK